MRKILAVALLGTVLPAAARDLPPDKLFKRASPSVVQVAIPITEEQTGSGSGVVIRHASLGVVVATNCHVLGNATRAFIKDGDGEVVAADLAARDRPRDLCLLRPRQSLVATPAQLANPKDLEIGDRVYAIGTPRGFSLTLSDGLVSGFRDLGGTRLIQSTAPISNGSSGGGLFDGKGRLVGVTTMFLANSQAMNFAVPASLLSSVPAYVAGAREPVGPAFPQWRVVHAAEGEEFAVDASSIRSSEGTISIWTRYRTDQARVVPGVPRPVSETIAHYQIFCEERSWWFDEYALRDAAGTLIDEDAVPEEAKEPIQDGSFGDYLHTNLCRAR